MEIQEHEEECDEFILKQDEEKEAEEELTAVFDTHMLILLYKLVAKPTREYYAVVSEKLLYFWSGQLVEIIFHQLQNNTELIYLPPEDIILLFTL